MIYCNSCRTLAFIYREKTPRVEVFFVEYTKEGSLEFNNFYVEDDLSKKSYYQCHYCNSEDAVYYKAPKSLVKKLMKMAKGKSAICFRELKLDEVVKIQTLLESKKIFLNKR